MRGGWALVLLLASPWVGAGAAAQPSDGSEADGTSIAPGTAWSIFGEKPDRRRVIAGIWALHPFESQFPELDPTRGVGVQVSSWFGASFVNSYGRRAYVAGLERNWATHTTSTFGLGVGYRAGVVTGYDAELVNIARHMPLLPFAGLLVWGDLGPIGIDAFYVYKAITFEASARF